MYSIEIQKKKVETNKILEFYNNKKVEKYCSNCKNYNRIWSCPPHNFDSELYLKQYKYILIISGKIILDKESFSNNFREEIISEFDKARKEFSKMVIDMEKLYPNSEAMISGGCFRCKVCKREINEHCILSNDKRYSLESLGLMVSDITSDILNLEIQWINESVPDYLLTVGGILFNE